MTVGELREKLGFFENHAQVYVMTEGDALVEASAVNFERPTEQNDDPARYPTNLVIEIQGPE